MDDNGMRYESGTDSTPKRTPYVRKPRPRKTQEAINDLEQDDTYAQGFTHDSNITVRSRNPLSGTVYSRSRGKIPQLKRELHYGQYLEIPKGKRQIFSSRERSAAIKSRAITAIILLTLLAVAIVAWMIIQNNT